MAKVLSSQGSKGMSHNLNDLYERWEARIESHEANGNISVPSMPALRNYKEAHDFKMFLHERFIEIKKASKRHALGSMDRALLDKRAENVKIMQMSIKQQMHGASWYKHSDPYQNVIRLIDVGLFAVKFNHETGLLDFFVNADKVATLHPEELNKLESIA